jgi:hypothetical protein
MGLGERMGFSPVGYGAYGYMGFYVMMKVELLTKKPQIFAFA